MSWDNEHGRRTFLTISAGGIATFLVACGDDTIAGTGTDGGSSSGGTSGTPATSDPGSTTSVDPTMQTGGGTTDPDGSGSTTSTDETGSESTDTDDPPVECETEGELIDWNPAGVALDEAVFPLAVMSGEMRPESAMFTIYVPDGAAKTFRLWIPAEGDQVHLVDERVVEPNADGFVKFTVDGLCPGTWYEYGYFVGKDDFTARSRIGHVRTAPADDALEPLVVALASCCGTSLDWPAIGVTNQEYFDMLLHLGDMAYNDGMETLDEYRASWRDWMSTPDYRNLFSSAGMFATWDDHEIDDNSNFDRETMDPAELLRRQNAMDAFFELLPIDAEGPDYRLWRSFRWGLTAEIIVLDCRYERRPSQDVYISEEQFDFLEDRLANSPCQFKIVMNSVPVTNMPLQWDVAASDRWDGYQDARNRLRNFVNDKDIDNVWFVSGDFHVSFVSRLEPQGDDNWSRVREVAVASGNENPIPNSLLSLNAPQFDYGINEVRACLMEFDPETNTVTLRFIRPNGDDAYFVEMTYGQ